MRCVAIIVVGAYRDRLSHLLTRTNGSRINGDQRSGPYLFARFSERIKKKSEINRTEMNDASARRPEDWSVTRGISGRHTAEKRDTAKESDEL